jgi:predicted transcriptional regulator
MELKEEEMELLLKNADAMRIISTINSCVCLKESEAVSKGAAKSVRRFEKAMGYLSTFGVVAWNWELGERKFSLTARGRRLIEYSTEKEKKDALQKQRNGI